MSISAAIWLVAWATFTPNLKRFAPDASEAQRKAEANRLFQFATHPTTMVAIPRLQQVAWNDPSPGVRANAVMAIGRITQRHKKPCPDVLFDALRDPDTDSVRVAAEMALYWHRPLPPGSTAKLLNYATTGDADQRDRGVALLAIHAPKSPEALKVIRAATDEPDEMHRHNARCALFKATDKIADFLPHIMWLHAEYHDRRKPADDSTEDTKRRYAWLGLVNIGVAHFLAEWTQNRTEELRDELLATSRHESAGIRLAVVQQWARFAEALRQPPPKPRADDQYDVVKQRAGLQAIVGSVAVRARLKEMAGSDPRAAVRETAKNTLTHLE